MSTTFTVLKRPLTRVVGNVVVSVFATGIELRRKRGRKRHFISWQRLASLLGEDVPLLEQQDLAEGQAKLRVLKMEFGSQGQGESEANREQ